MSRPSDSADAFVNATIGREQDARSLGHVSGGKGRALSAEARRNLRALAHRCELVTMPPADLLELLDATEAKDG